MSYTFAKVGLSPAPCHNFKSLTIVDKSFLVVEVVSLAFLLNATATLELDATNPVAANKLNNFFLVLFFLSLGYFRKYYKWKF
ncbi:hypothetical protein [Spiroplasma helicoides]|nr:hypothetical protein [Spiroplasma helicoides]